jgi:hypothetical protein
LVWGSSGAKNRVKFCWALVMFPVNSKMKRMKRKKRQNLIFN